MEEKVGSVKQLLRVHKGEHPVALSKKEIDLLREIPQADLLKGLTGREVNRLTKLLDRAGLTIPLESHEQSVQQ